MRTKQCSPKEVRRLAADSFQDVVGGTGVNEQEQVM
jgi:hypothetical protein